jgi:hypothetical protein
MHKKKLALALSAISLTAFSVSAQAAEFVQDGGFESVSGSAGVINTDNTLSNWTNHKASNGDPGYNLIATAAQYKAGISKYSFALPSSIVASPNGGEFVAMDGAADTAALTQQLSGLTPNSPATVSFYIAATQQVRYTGFTTEAITVDLGGASQTYHITGPGSSYNGGSSLPTQGFTGWQQVTMTFTPTVSNPTLSFLASGTPNGQPPFTLLDGVSVTQNTTSVPFEFSPEQGFLLGVPLFLGLRKLKKRKLVK